jgi:hypothetical protein
MALPYGVIIRALANTKAGPPVITADRLLIVFEMIDAIFFADHALEPRPKDGGSVVGRTSWLAILWEIEAFCGCEA